jgi:hypothetical protein
MKTIKSVKTILKLPGIPAGTEGIFIKANNNHDEQWDFGSGFAFAQGYMEQFPDFFEITYEQEPFKIGDWIIRKDDEPSTIGAFRISIDYANYWKDDYRKATDAEIKFVTEKEIYITAVRFLATKGRQGRLEQLEYPGGTDRFIYLTDDLRKACDIADNLPER